MSISSSADWNLTFRAHSNAPSIMQFLGYQFLQSAKMMPCRAGPLRGFLRLCFNSRDLSLWSVKVSRSPWDQRGGSISVCPLP